MTDEEARIDITQAQKRVASILGETQAPIGFASTVAASSTTSGPVTIPPPGYHLVTRGARKGQIAKDRADKGTHRAPKPQPGAISQEQANTLRKLIEVAHSANEQKAAAEMEAEEMRDAALKAEDMLNRFIDSLAGK